jgi:hypothetical protein
MHKLKLEDLAVDSFSTSDMVQVRGTIVGNQPTVYYVTCQPADECRPSYYCTPVYTANIAQSCQLTCYTCPFDKCGYNDNTLSDCHCGGGGGNTLGCTGGGATTPDAAGCPVNEA